MMNYYGYGYDYGHFLGWGILGMTIMVLFWVLVVMLVIRLVRWLAGDSNWHDRKMCRWQCWNEMSGGDSALDILRERYAKGEINKTEFEEKKKDILN